jgi:predicted pyridoxine 5'-phosphate oxidase superfamily flavin-nucleotide-binding protein
MAHRFLDIAATASVKAAQAANGSDRIWSEAKSYRACDRFTAAEVAFIAERDSFYMATVSETGWPYVQHRGGPPGFLRVMNATTLAFADFRGNKQYITLGNAAANDRGALFLMDYPERAFVLHLEAFDWNCSQHITPRFAEPEIDVALMPVRARIAQLEAENKMLRNRLNIAEGETNA